MTRKNVIVIGSLAAALAALIFFAGRHAAKELRPPVVLGDSSSASVESDSSVSVESAVIKERTETETAEETKLEGATWESYADKAVAAILEAYGRAGISPPHEEDLRARIASQIEYLKARGVPLSEVVDPSQVVYTVTEGPVVGPPRYTGPQTAEAIWAEYGDILLPEWKRVGEVNELYPPKEWIQRLLERGAVIDDSTDFQTYFSLRGRLAGYYRSRDERLQNMDPRISSRLLTTRELYGLPEDAPWVDVENAIIDKRIRTWLEEERELRSDQRTVRVHIDEESFSSSMVGEPLTDEQEFALIFHGVIPDGINVVYVDEDQNPIAWSVRPQLSYEKRVANLSDEDWLRTAEMLFTEEFEKHIPEPGTLDWMAMTGLMSAMLTVPREFGASGGASSSNAGKAPPSLVARDPTAPNLKAGEGGSETPGLFHSPLENVERREALLDYLDKHLDQERLYENESLPSELRQALKTQSEAYRKWRQEDQLRRQKEETLRRQEPASPPADENSQTAEDEDEEE